MSSRACPIPLFPKAIVHIDGDAFFASCEQALHPQYKNKPVVVGADRGIATAFSYEAKRQGVHRGMTLREIKRVCPDAILVAGDYEAYSLFSKRLFTIMRRFSDLVEEYSIDEGFMDITGLEGTMHQSYPEITQTIKATVQKELGITVSAGLAPTKVLAKLASSWSKPDGYAHISMRDLPEYLRDFSIDKIWGIGTNTAASLRQANIFSAYDFAVQSAEYIQQHCAKPQYDIWQELNGKSVYSVISEEKNSFASISKTSTFRHGRNDASKVYAELVQNIENACTKARQYNLAAKRVSIFLKSESFTIHALEACLTRASSYPPDIINVIKPLFSQLYESGKGYRATGIILSDLGEDTFIQDTLFESPVKLTTLKNIYHAVDTLAKKFGKHTVQSGGALKAEKYQPLLHGPLISAGLVH